MIKNESGVMIDHRFGFFFLLLRGDERELYRIVPPPHEAILV